MSKRKRYAIQHDNGTYFSHWAGIGPAFGADLVHARKFSSRQDAMLTQGQHYGFVMTEIVEAGVGEEAELEPSYYSKAYREMSR